MRNVYTYSARGNYGDNIPISNSNWGNPLSPPGFLEEIKCRSGCCTFAYCQPIFCFPARRPWDKRRETFSGINFQQHTMKCYHNRGSFSRASFVFFKNQIGRACVNDRNFICVSWCEQWGQPGYEITGRSHVPSMLAIIMLMQKSMAAYSWERDYDGVKASLWAHINKSTPWELNKQIAQATLTCSSLVTRPLQG